MSIEKGMRRIGVIIAMPGEYRALCRALGIDLASADTDADDAGMHAPAADELAASLRQIEVGERRIVMLCSGIGKVNATMAAMKLLRDHQVEILASVGTAGHLGGRDAGAFVVDHAVQHDYGSRRSSGFETYPPGAIPIGEPGNPIFVSSLARILTASTPALPTAGIASGDAFVEDRVLSIDIHERLGVHLVDMECAAIAQVAERHAVHWLGVKAVSDEADHESSESIIANLQRASAEAAALFVRVLEKLP